MHVQYWRYKSTDNIILPSCPCPIVPYPMFQVPCPIMYHVLLSHVLCLIMTQFPCPISQNIPCSIISHFQSCPMARVWSWPESEYRISMVSRSIKRLNVQINIRIWRSFCRSRSVTEREPVYKLNWTDYVAIYVCMWLYDYWPNTKNAVLWLATMFPI